MAVVFEVIALAGVLLPVFREVVGFPGEVSTLFPVPVFRLFGLIVFI
jgi:hypothetical protein